MTDLDRSDFVFRVITVAAALACAMAALFVFVAIVSPEVRIDVPGVSARGGGGGD